MSKKDLNAERFWDGYEKGFEAGVERGRKKGIELGKKQGYNECQEDILNLLEKHKEMGH